MSSGGERPHPGRVRFLQNVAPDYRIAAANGAQGGLTPHGDYLIEFYCERPQSPVVSEHQLQQGGELGPRIQPSAEEEVPQIERYVHFAVMMSQPQAETLARWILDNLRRAEGRQ